jgi:hypothetical protein
MSRKVSICLIYRFIDCPIYQLKNKDYATLPIIGEWVNRSIGQLLYIFDRLDEKSFFLEKIFTFFLIFKELFINSPEAGEFPLQMK